MQRVSICLGIYTLNLWEMKERKKGRQKKKVKQRGRTRLSIGLI